LSCFFLPRLLDDGEKNAVRIARLKDKLGNRSNASSEVEFEGARASLLGEEGRGVPVIIEMVRHTRLDCAIGSAGIVRGAVAQALHHARHRRAFGRRLIEQPLMQNVLADLVIEAEAATALALRLARAFESDAGAADAALARIATPAIKYWVCKRAPAAVAEAAEVLGGSGYVEECPLPRAYREAPLNSIWEGSGNVMCLDVLRAARREPAAIETLRDELALASGADTRLDRHAAAILGSLSRSDTSEREARRIAGGVAVGLAASLLVRHAPAAVADAYCGSRLGESESGAFGTLPNGIDFAGVIDSAGA
jgi:putative acyl-CoA dehydrogenase